MSRWGMGGGGGWKQAKKPNKKQERLASQEEFSVL